MIKQTTCIDNIKCPICGHLFNGQEAINGDMDCMSQDVYCPNCGVYMDIDISVEYMATVETDD